METDTNKMKFVTIVTQLLKPIIEKHVENILNRENIGYEYREAFRLDVQKLFDLLLQEGFDVLETEGGMYMPIVMGYLRKAEKEMAKRKPRLEDFQ